MMRSGRGSDARAERLRALLADGGLPQTPLHPCPYLPGLEARERFFLARRLDPELYHDLMDRGFRRSGGMFYATDCPGCRRCIPLRVPVADFTPSRSQRRVLRKNRDVAVRVRRPEFSRATFDLFRRYRRHQHGPPASAESPDACRAWLYAAVVETVEVVYTIGTHLAALSLLDVCSRSVSSVYHFYAPDLARRSLGVLSVLAEIEWTRQIGVPYYYLGYWVEGAKTMHYKASYRPHELLLDGAWRLA
jgi:arginine-tRNA-protein transferase